MAGQQTITMVIAGDAARLVKALKTSSKETTALGTTFKALSVTAGIAFSAIGYAATRYLGSSIKAASDLYETTSKVNVIFGESAKTLTTLAQTASTSLGQTQTQFLNAASTFGVFGKAAKLSNKENVKFSLTLTKLATDLASFNNTTVDEAIVSIGAALRGESEPIRKYGVLLDDATLKAEAFAQGIYDGKGALEPGTRVLAAYGAILKQTTLQQNDFNRTQTGYANQLRTVQAQLGTLKETIGGIFLPIASDVLPVLSQAITKLTDNQEFKDSLKALAQSLKDNLPAFIEFIPKLIEGFTGLVKAIKDLLPIAQGIIDFGNTTLIPLGYNLNDPRGAAASNAANARAAAGGGAIATTVNINVNAVSSSAETGRAIANALSNYYRHGGRQVR